MKNLIFNVKRNLKKPPKVYVVSPDKKVTYGSFTAVNPAEFDGWEALSTEQTIELKQYMHNMDAISHYFEAQGLNEQTDFRVRLPTSFIECINKVSAIAFKNDLELDVFEPMITTIIQQLKIVTAKLPPEDKQRALGLLEQVGLTEYKKIDYSTQIQAVFTELLPIHNKAEKLEVLAKELFNKDKGISPKSIDAIATGQLSTSKWLTACAIEILRQEKPIILNSFLSHDDLFMLWAKQLLDRGVDRSVLLVTASSLGIPELVNKIESYQCS